MKLNIRVVSSKKEIKSLGSGEKIIHFSYRPSEKDILAVVKVCPNLKAVHISRSYTRTVSKSIKMFLDMQGIALLEGDVWGHRHDINKYSEINLAEVSDRIQELKYEGLSTADILDRLIKETRFSMDLVQFVVSDQKIPL